MRHRRARRQSQRPRSTSPSILEGTTLCAKDMPGSIAVMAMAEAGTLLAAPDVYMHKIAVGPGYPKGVVDLDASPEENIHSLARAKGVKPHEITTLVLDRPRHVDLIAAIRRTGAGVRLISDGDVAGVIFTTKPEETGIDLYPASARRKASSRPAPCAASAARWGR
jgi:fructose-1,6-bisphosphatase II / sedoheptulose-1,7-bisphosphatase